MQTNSLLSALCVVILGGLMASYSAVAAPLSAKKDLHGRESNIEKKGNSSKDDENKKYDINDFQYVSEGKRDPFQAVLITKAIAAKEVKSTKSKKASSDIKEYELEAMKLVGVLKSDKGMIAMMEDSQGRGVFFRKNDPLNKNMWIADITTKDVTMAYKLKGEIKKVVVEIPEKK